MDGSSGVPGLLVAVLALGLAAAPTTADAQPAAVVVEAVQAREGRPVQVVATAGEIVPVRSIVIRNEVAGVIAQIAFADGARAREGDLLLTLDDRLYSTSVAETRAALELARKDYERVKQLGSSGYGRKADVDNALATMQRAAAMLERAEIELAQTAIVAPFGGVLGIRRAHQGQYLEAGTDLVALDDISSVLVHFRLPQRYLGQVEVGDRVTITAGQTGDQRFEARVGAIDPGLDPKTRTIRLQGSVVNIDGRLRPGQFVTVTLTLPAGDRQVFVPEAAVVYDGESRWAVRVVDGRSQPGKVTTGIHFSGMIGITSGIAAGDTVVVAGQEKVIGGGVPVKVLAPSFLTAESSGARIIADDKP